MNEGNKNAEKYDFDTSIDLFDKVLKSAFKKYEYIVQGKPVEGYLCHFIGEACDDAGVNLDTLRYLREKYDLKHLYSNIKRKCEANCFQDAKKGVIVPSLAIINLKSNHGWTDRVDNTTKGNEVSTTTVINLGDGKKPD